MSRRRSQPSRLNSPAASRSTWSLLSTPPSSVTAARSARCSSLHRVDACSHMCDPLPVSVLRELAGVELMPLVALQRRVEHADQLKVVVRRGHQEMAVVLVERVEHAGLQVVRGAVGGDHLPPAGDAVAGLQVPAVLEVRLGAGPHDGVREGEPHLVRCQQKPVAQPVAPLHALHFGFGAENHPGNLPTTQEKKLMDRISSRCVGFRRISLCDVRQIVRADGTREISMNARIALMERKSSGAISTSLTGTSKRSPIQAIRRSSWRLSTTPLSSRSKSASSWSAATSGANWALMNVLMSVSMDMATPVDVPRARRSGRSCRCRFAAAPGRRSG